LVKLRPLPSDLKKAAFERLFYFVAELARKNALAVSINLS
jgi:hypothetical protein